MFDGSNATTEIQAINKILRSSSYDLIDRGGLTDVYFDLYKDQFNFIIEHHEKYGNVPDFITFQTAFEEFPVVEVTESDDYLLDRLHEEYAYRMLCPVMKECAALSNDGKTFDAVELFLQHANELSALAHASGGTDINQIGDKLYDLYMQKGSADSDYLLSTSFGELDERIGGLRKGEELCVIYARTNNAKSWILDRILSYNNSRGHVVGLFSPEMSAETVAYRINTLDGHFDNFALSTGRKLDNQNEYKEYLGTLKDRKPFLVSSPRNFGRKATISKLRRWCITNKIEILGIDGISYLTDERYRRGDNKTTTLTNISEDLMQLSCELKIPIIVVAQANRSGVSDSNPELDSIRDSDGISHNASIAISSRLVDDILTLKVTKARYSKLGDKIRYQCDLNSGTFEATSLDSSRNDLLDDLPPVRDHGVVNKQPLRKSDKSNIVW